MNNIKVLGIDLAKDVFQLHGTDAHGKKVLSVTSQTKQPIPLCFVSPYFSVSSACF